MSSLTQLIGAGAKTNQGAGVSFEGMPLTATCYTLGGNVISPYNIYIRSPGGYAYASRDNSTFFTSIATEGAVGYITQSDTWTTIVSTTGTRGKLTHIILPVWRPGSGAVSISIDAEVTIDGKTHTYTIPTISTGINETGIIGSIYPTHNTFGTPYNAPAPAADADPGFGGYSYYIPSPRTAIAYGAPYLNWTNDMQVRIKMNQQSGGLAGMYGTDLTAAAAYVLE